MPTVSQSTTSPPTRCKDPPPHQHLGVSHSEETLTSTPSISIAPVGQKPRRLPEGLFTFQRLSAADRTPRVQLINEHYPLTIADEESEENFD